MPIRSVRNDSVETTLNILEGEVTFKELVEAITTVYANSPTKNSIWDLTNGTVEKLTGDDIRSVTELAKNYNHLREGGKTAWVAPKDIDFAYCRMSEGLGYGAPIEKHVFRSMDEALEWISDGSDGL